MTVQRQIAFLCLAASVISIAITAQARDFESSGSSSFNFGMQDHTPPQSHTQQDYFAAVDAILTRAGVDAVFQKRYT